MKRHWLLIVVAGAAYLIWKILIATLVEVAETEMRKLFGLDPKEGGNRGDHFH